MDNWNDCIKIKHKKPNLLPLMHVLAGLISGNLIKIIEESITQDVTMITKTPSHVHATS
jgi:hypothetical protein